MDEQVYFTNMHMGILHKANECFDNKERYYETLPAHWPPIFLNNISYGIRGIWRK